MYTLHPPTFFKCLADNTRLMSILLIAKVGEACVCDLMQALALGQPNTSRHLAQLRKCGILDDERRGKWVFYRLHPELPTWANEVIQTTANHNADYLKDPLNILESASSSNPSRC